MTRGKQKNGKKFQKVMQTYTKFSIQEKRGSGDVDKIAKPWIIYK
jgi:hypothetical protein